MNSINPCHTWIIDNTHTMVASLLDVVLFGVVLFGVVLFGVVIFVVLFGVVAHCMHLMGVVLPLL